MLEQRKSSILDVNASSGLSKSHTDLLNQYLDLIKKWDRVYSLVSKGDINYLEQRHVSDSLALESFLEPQSVHLDIGSGAGFPGIPLAIYRPDVHIVVNDRSKKKCRFLREVKFRLDLANVEVLECDIGQKTLPKERFHTISIRAVAPPDVAWSMACPLLRDNGLVLLHSQDQFATGVNVFRGGVVHSCTPSVRGWVTGVTLSSTS